MHRIQLRLEKLRSRLRRVEGLLQQNLDSKTVVFLPNAVYQCRGLPRMH